MIKRKGEALKGRRKSQNIDDVSDVNTDMDGPLKPGDQLQLSEGELKEEITKVLTATNPHAPDNIVRFNFKENMYKQIPKVDQMEVHFQLEGNMIYIESDEAKMQLGIVDDDGGEEEEGNGEEEEEHHLSETASGANQEGDHDTRQTKSAPKESQKKLVNQFNFCEHATQTYNNALRDRGILTEPPARGNFSANITQWGIFDFYQRDVTKKALILDKKTIAARKLEKKKNKKKNTTADIPFDDITKFLKPVQIIERMINQNTFDDVLQDFAYYEDASDEFRDSLGTLLPLWKFSYDKAKKLAVTALCWSPKYNDLFAVGLGSYDFLKQVPGMICFYSLKNPGYPEYIFETESGVLCLDIHPDYPYLVCVGFYDGSVGVYKLNQEKVGPLYLSTANTNKHTDPVWQVRWLSVDGQPNLIFFSISADGRVSSWNVLKSGVGALHECPEDITCYDVLLMHAPKESGDDQGSGQISSFECGTAMDFHKKDPHLFLIATEEGMVHQCSKAYSSQYLTSIKAHYMAVYRLAWNNFHDDIFITCSADWTVKIWQQRRKDPVFSFDLGAPVGDVAWAPYSSTVFAAVTADGNVHVYDLNVNKYEPLCRQMVAQKKRTKLTHIAFNPVHPIIICGDDRGQIMSLKLSPNLRKKPKEKKGLEKPNPVKVEIEKLETLLSLVG